MSKVVEEYWSGVARRLQEEVDTFNKLIGHAGEQGRENELSLVRLIENLLPSTVGVGSGMVIDSHGNYSKQMDILIYDVSSQPSIMAQTNQVIFPVECVLLAIEVKTTLTEEELRDCVAKRKSLRNLSPGNDGEAPCLAVMAYHADGMAPTVTKNILSHDVTDRPELICVVEPGIIAGSKRLVYRDDCDDFIVGVAGLHEMDRTGTRTSGNFQRPTEVETQAHILRAGSSYPVARLGLSRKDRVIGEPGRALLIFCAAIMDMLTSVSNLPQSVINYYLQDPARELLETS
ncbi:DUF6602 domain-containing protein [Streptomyces sp. NBC_01217]|uniref:DUF6602 domain-containing protein n=1 Tax=Streptomyces sp. NBC_01217 TaxID=2903779 RepID=UPI002E108711|nr:hypothetical protein OG507_30780 [Streptomyces sp. NBC_01217]